MNTRPTILAAVAAQNNDQHTNEGSGSDDRSTVDDRRHNNILSTPHQNSSLILHHLDKYVDLSLVIMIMYTSYPPPLVSSRALMISFSSRMIDSYCIANMCMFLH
jgi:hypothetical protein